MFGNAFQHGRDHFKETLCCKDNICAQVVHANVYFRDTPLCRPLRDYNMVADARKESLWKHAKGEGEQDRSNGIKSRYMAGAEVEGQHGR